MKLSSTHPVPFALNVCALVLIRISLNFITVIPRRIIAEDVKYRNFGLFALHPKHSLSMEKISRDNGFGCTELEKENLDSSPLTEQVEWKSFSRAFCSELENISATLLGMMNF